MPPIKDKTETIPPRMQTTMRIRPDVMDALAIEAEKQSHEFRLSVSRSRVIENVLLDYCNSRGHKLPKGFGRGAPGYSDEEAEAGLIDPME